LNRLDTLTSSAGFAQEFTYYSNGQRKKLVETHEDYLFGLSSTATTDWTYDADGRLTAESRFHDYPDDDPGSPLPTYSYATSFGYDLAGNRLTKSFDDQSSANKDE